MKYVLTVVFALTFVLGVLKSHADQSERETFSSIVVMALSAAMVFALWCWKG